MNRFLGVTTETLSRTQSLWSLIPLDIASCFAHIWAIAIFTVIQNKKKALPAAPLPCTEDLPSLCHFRTDAKAPFQDLPWLKECLNVSPQCGFLPTTTKNPLQEFRPFLNNMQKTMQYPERLSRICLLVIGMGPMIYKATHCRSTPITLDEKG